MKKDHLINIFLIFLAVLIVVIFVMILSNDKYYNSKGVIREDYLKHQNKYDRVLDSLENERSKE